MVAPTDFLGDGVDQRQHGIGDGLGRCLKKIQHKAVSKSGHADGARSQGHDVSVGNGVSYAKEQSLGSENAIGNFATPGRIRKSFDSALDV
ncbi:hypothetical protein AFERRID_07580 [Acidithiobacillus ferridurans]|uniref:Uncharacterized protein n=1 Tax=Acidithiobacillus ferridurans TaxID=1232575 RepID=A0A2Z6IFW7_ACIFI|nr:hypothetical protein AFERRID_07580 [Acidithiobacillus ferridurans]